MVKKNELLKALKADLTAADISNKDWTGKRDDWISESYGNLYGNEQKGRSKIVSKDIKKQLEWMIPSMTDPFLSTPDVIKCSPVTYEDVQAARQNELLLNTQFTRKFNRYNFINKASRVLAVEGTVVVQTGWDYEDEEIENEVEAIVVDEYGNEHIQKQTITETKVVRNKPTAEVIRNEDVFLDPTCMGDMDKCQFVIYRFETDLSTLRKDKRYKNLKKVAVGLLSEDTDYIAEDDTQFEFEDAARKKVLVYEYWGNYDMDGDGIVEPIVCTWVEDTIIRLEDNPYPDKKLPFIVVPFTPIPFQLEGESLAENIGDNQKIKTAITRGLIDNMARSNNGQVGIRKGSLSMADKKKFLKGDNFEFQGSPNDFWQGSYNQIPGSAFNMLSLMNNEIESQTGVKSFSGGISGNSMGNTATAARGAMDATAMRRLNLVRNIAENLIKPLMRKWMAYNAEFLDEEEVVRITNSEFIPIRRDDLEGKIDIDISISTAEDNNAKAQQLSFMLQTIGNSIDSQLTTELIAEIADLQKMPALAEKLRNWEPRPNQMQEEQARLEIEKLKAEVYRLNADAQRLIKDSEESGEDVILKRAKAELEIAKAKKLNSDSDLIDLKFLKENEGISHAEKLEQEYTKAELAKDLAMLQAKLGDKNIGIYNG